MPRASAPASQLAFSELSVRNYGLFANHFLEKRLPLMAEWLAESARINAVFAELQTLYKSKGAAMSDATNEAQTENDWIQPVFNLLWGQNCYQVQVNLPNSDGRGQPDYALFTSPSARDGAEGFKGTLAYWSEVAVVGDAKKWGDSLDKTRKGETPGAQISRYLFQTNKRWGILTNGRVWRLYEQDKARSGGTYYEVDLETILKSGDRESFKGFYFFFRREAFAPGAAGVSFIEQVFKGSAETAQDAGDLAHGGTVEAQNQLADASVRLVRDLGTSVDNTFDSGSPEDAMILGEWASASLIEVRNASPKTPIAPVVGK